MEEEELAIEAEEEKKKEEDLALPSIPSGFHWVHCPSSTDGALVNSRVLYLWSTGWEIGTVVKFCKKLHQKKFNFLEYNDEQYPQLLSCSSYACPTMKDTFSAGSWFIVEANKS